ncbi:MFS transporter [bacterium]|nr:MFS transporter [bacterium]
MAQATPPQKPQSPWQEISQPFIDLWHAPRALWGINLAYFLEGWVYFGMLGYLAMYFSDLVFQGDPHADINSHHMVLVLTAGITISMFFFGGLADKWGIRRTLLIAFVFLLAGRVVISAAPLVSSAPGMWGTWHLLTMAGIVVVVLGYGLYQPAAYAGVRKFTTGATAAMGYAMLYALMNLGGWLPSFFSDVRQSIGITGAFWVYTGLTLVALLATFFILTRKVEEKAAAAAEAARAEEKKAAGQAAAAPTAAGDVPGASVDVDASIPAHMWVTLAAIAGCVAFLPSHIAQWTWAGLGAVFVAVVAIPGWRTPTRVWLANHPLANSKFFFFIFALIPVQTLFTYNWLILPQYLERAFEGGVVSERFEIFSNMNPILIFFAVPIVTALTQKQKIYNMMIIGTLVMAAPAFLLAVGTNLYTLLGYLLVMTIGEAMWQPRFLQYAAEIAPEGRTGAYMGVAQFPWFLTKVVVPLYSGIMLTKYVPAEGPRDPQTMWLYFAIIAMVSPVLLVLFRGWVGELKERSE